MDTFGASGLTLLFIACCETIAVAWIYGNSNSDPYFPILEASFLLTIATYDDRSLKGYKFGIQGKPLKFNPAGLQTAPVKIKRVFTVIVTFVAFFLSVMIICNTRGS